MERSDSAEAAAVILADLVGRLKGDGRSASMAESTKDLHNAVSKLGKVSRSSSVFGQFKYFSVIRYLYRPYWFTADHVGTYFLCRQSSGHSSLTSAKLPTFI